MGVKIQLNTNTVDFELGEVEVSATYTLETIKLVMANKEKVQEDLKQIQISLSDVENVSEETIDTAIQSYLQGAEEAFKPIFGEGSFTKVYESCHDIVATAEAFSDAMDYLNDKIEKETAQKKKDKQKKLAKYKK